MVMLPAHFTTSLIVNILRGPVIESRHLVHALVMNGAGETVASYGDIGRLTFPRSTLKLLQALPLVESGAAERFNLSDAEVALACASHSGEEKHVSAVAAWLARLGLDETALECGAQPPRTNKVHGASALCNNCSGKHAGMLTLALDMKAPTTGYTNVDHPVQRAILARIGEICGAALAQDVCGIDGCSAPNPAMPLQNLARGFAALIKETSPGARRILQALAKHPDLVAGTDKLDTVLIESSGGAVISKTGAEGVYIALIPSKDAVVALKAEDGATRAAQAALYTLLEKHQLADRAALDALRPIALPVLRNWRGTETGKITVETSP